MFETCLYYFVVKEAEWLLCWNLAASHYSQQQQPQGNPAFPVASSKMWDLCNTIIMQAGWYSRTMCRLPSQTRWKEKTKTTLPLRRQQFINEDDLLDRIYFFLPNAKGDVTDSWMRLVDSVSTVWPQGWKYLCQDGGNLQTKKKKINGNLMHWTDILRNI